MLEQELEEEERKELIDVDEGKVEERENRFHDVQVEGSRKELEVVRVSKCICLSPNRILLSPRESLGQRERLLVDQELVSSGFVDLLELELDVVQVESEEGNLEVQVILASLVSGMAVKASLPNEVEAGVEEELPSRSKVGEAGSLVFGQVSLFPIEYCYEVEVQALLPHPPPLQKIRRLQVRRFLLSSLSAEEEKAREGKQGLRLVSIVFESSEGYWMCARVLELQVR